VIGSRVRRGAHRRRYGRWAGRQRGPPAPRHSRV